MKKIQLIGRKIGTIAFALSAVLAFTACKTGTSAKENEKNATVVNIGTMDLVNGDLIAQYEKYYEQELGVKVNIVKFDSGKDVNTALAAGSIDISELGTAPTALGLSSGTDFQVIWTGDIIGKAESLVVKENSGIQSVKDLKGKKIATPFASTAHYSLLNAIRAAGLSEKDVTLIDLQTANIYAAWQRGDIDGAYIWYPVLDKLIADGGKVITHSGELANKGIITADLTVVRTAFAEANPEIVTKYIKTQIKANDVILNQPDQAAKEIGEKLEISQKDAAEQLTQFKYLTAKEEQDFLNNELSDTLKKTADFLVEQNSIKTALNLEEFKKKINTKYLDDAVKTE